MQPPPYGSGYPPNNPYPPQGQQYPPPQGPGQNYPPAGPGYPPPQGQYPPPAGQGPPPHGQGPPPQGQGPYPPYPSQPGGPPPSYYPTGAYPQGPPSQQQPSYQGAYSHASPSQQPYMSGYNPTGQYQPPGQGGPPSGQNYPPPPGGPAQSNPYPYGAPPNTQNPYMQGPYAQGPSYPSPYYPPSGPPNPQYPQHPPPGGPPSSQGYPASAGTPASGPPQGGLQPSPSMSAYPPPVSSAPHGAPPPGAPSYPAGPPQGPLDPTAMGMVGNAPPPQLFRVGSLGHHLTRENFPKVIGVPSEDGCGNLHVPDMMGPMLRYNTMNIQAGRWLGSVLFVMRNLTPDQRPPTLIMSIREKGNPIMAPYPVHAEHLYPFHGWNFWRFPLDIPMAHGETERHVEYNLEGGRDRWSFWVPGQQQSWHWSYYSCAGYSSSLEASKKVHFDDLVMDLLRRHKERPHHLCFGGGDQLYNDQVFRLRTVAEWQDKPREMREMDRFTPAMEAEAETYYFAHYMTHYSHRWMSQLVSSIPQMMMWDDHDIFDGFGSYPPSLQNCEVFQRLYKVARFFYLLFQHHTTDGLAERHGLIKTNTALTQLAYLGPRVVLLAVDMRSERLKHQILPPGGWQRIEEELRKAPPTVKHVVVGSGVPVVYPSLGEVEAILESISEANRNPAGTGIGGAIQNVLGGAMNMVFDEPELLDDLNDHWNAKGHLKEKEEMIRMFQLLASTRGMRISFLSGDVHLCATGRLRTQGKDKKETDPNYMLQVVSSAIVNDPPPDGLVTFLSQKALTSTIIFGNTEERMRATFGGGILNVANVKSKLLNRRNFCLIQETVDQSLIFTIVVEMPGSKYKLYPTTVPPIQLDIVGAMQGMNLQSYRSASMDPRGQQDYAPGKPGQGPPRSSTFAGY